MVTSDSEYVAGTIQKRRAEARRRPGQDPRNGRRPAALQRRGPPEREPSAATPRASRTRIMTRISQTRCTSFNCSSNEVFGPFSNSLLALVYRYCYLFVIWQVVKGAGSGGQRDLSRTKGTGAPRPSMRLRRFRRRGIWRGRQATDWKCWSLRVACGEGPSAKMANRPQTRLHYGYAASGGRGSAAR